MGKNFFPLGNFNRVLVLYIFQYLSPLQWHRGRSYASHAGDRGLIPAWSRQTEVVKTGCDRSTDKCSATGINVTGLCDDHYKGLAHVTVGVAH